MKDMNSSSLVVAPTRAAGMRGTAASRRTAYLAAGARANYRSSGENSCSATIADLLRIPAMDDSRQRAA